MLSHSLYKKGEIQLINASLDWSCFVCSFVCFSELPTQFNKQGSRVTKNITTEYFLMKSKHFTISDTWLKNSSTVFSGKKEAYLAQRKRII